MIRPSTALAFGIGAWAYPAWQWAAYYWLGRAHPLDPGATKEKP